MKFKYLLYTLPALLLASCSNDEPGLGSGAPGAAVVTANIGAVTSRASGTQWTADDRIGISGTTGSVTYTNVPYVTAAGDGTFAPLNGVAAGIFFQDSNPAAFSAYYPYSADVTADNSVISASTADQTQAETFDFLYATGAKGSLSSPALNFIGNAAFSHRMAQLVITLSVDRNDGFNEGVETVTDKGRITLGGLVKEGEFDTATGIASASGTTANFILSNADIDGDTAKYSLILFPQTADNVELLLEYNGNFYRCTFIPTLVAGKRCTTNITLRKTGLTVGNAEITDWEENGSFTGDATIPPDYVLATEGEVDLSTLKKRLIVDGTVTLTGKPSLPNFTVTLANDAELTVRGVQMVDKPIICEGNATITFDGKNDFTGYSSKPCIQPGPKGTTLTLKGINQDDTLMPWHVWSYENSNHTTFGPPNQWETPIFIGVRDGEEGGDIVFESGVYYFLDRLNDCNVGSIDATIGNITINGGTYLYNNYCEGNEAGSLFGTLNGTCGVITVNDGTFYSDGSKPKRAVVFGASGSGTCEGVAVNGGTFKFYTPVTIANPDPYPYKPTYQMATYFEITE